MPAIPGASRVLEHHGLDYCCGGKRHLAAACADLGVDLDVVVHELDDIRTAEPGFGSAWAAMPPADLVDHIERTHHAFLKAELPRLDALAEKVTGVHGHRHPELAEVRDLLGALRADLEPHLAKEEQVLFPMIRELAASSTRPTFHCGSLQNPISVMLIEHDRVGELLERLRTTTSTYQTPADGCASYRALYEGLAELEHDTHVHVHKENNVLFPAVVTLETVKDDARVGH